MLLNILRDHMLIRYLQYVDVAKLFQLNQNYNELKDQITIEYIKSVKSTINLSELLKLAGYMSLHELRRVSTYCLDYLPKDFGYYYKNINSSRSPHRYYLDDIIYNPTKDIKLLVEEEPTIYKSKTVKIKIAQFNVYDKYLNITIDHKKIHSFTIKSTFNRLIGISDKRIKIQNYQHYIFNYKTYDPYAQHRNLKQLIDKTLELISRSDKIISYKFPD